MQLKICGMKQPQNIADVAALINVEKTVDFWATHVKLDTLRTQGLS